MEFKQYIEAIEDMSRIVGHLGPLTLGKVAEIKINFPDADFWIKRRGSEDQVGKPTREFNKEDIGIKVTDTNILEPNYLYYMMEYLHSTKYWKHLSRGILKLSHISVKDVKDLPLQQQ